jgi:hypothetical protein
LEKCLPSCCIATTDAQFQHSAVTSEHFQFITLPLCLVTVQRTKNSLKLFKLSRRCHIYSYIKVEAYKSQNTFTQWFQSLALNLISPRIEINSGVEADKAAGAFTACIAPAYRLSTSKINLSELNNDLPGLHRLLKYKKRMSKLQQETRDPGCKKEFNRVSKSIRLMTQKRHLNGGKKIANTEPKRQAIWPIAKSLRNRDGPSTYCHSWSFRSKISSGR